VLEARWSERVRALSTPEAGLAVAVTQRRDGSPLASVVNAGVADHPVTGDRIVGFVSRGGARKLTHLRRWPQVTVVFRSGWQWLAVEGNADLAGPDDVLAGLDPAAIPELLRNVYAAAVGGTSGDWAALDDIMAAERHAAVLVRPERVYPAFS
jgi:hypothetical protein